ncbi:tRNA lysidine(34) synthetase TilS [Allohahella marinimesophila]|uniref:tRNA(Ile)-lysidine synthase n=1 Tax=Allohahella marinimesophila TaxID=1054972 RepID=A0ABP7PRV3_9GAMM
MTNTSEQALILRVFERLDALTADSASSFSIAYSGGLDSHLLLCLSVRWWQDLPERERPSLRAIHVDHGLQAASSEWAQRCMSACDLLGVPLDIVPVKVHARGSSEAAARLARYGVFEAHLPAQGVLLQGHHLDDQAETVLYRLALGHGLDGLSGIPQCRVLGQGGLFRPFLAAGLQRRDLELLEITLVGSGMPPHPVNDPSNTDTVHDRNYLRHVLLPPLLSRWPSALARMNQSAQYLSEAAELCETLAELDLVQVEKGACEVLGSDYLARLPLSELYQWPVPRQRNLLRYWLKQQSLSLSEGGWAELLGAVERSSHDSGHQANVELAESPASQSSSKPHDLPGARCGETRLPQPVLLSLYQRALFIHIAGPDRQTAGSLGIFAGSSPEGDCVWPMHSTVIAPEPGQIVSCEPRAGAIRIKVAGRHKSTTLKKLLSERRLLPWERDALPLICYDGEPVSMPGVFVSAAHSPDTASTGADATAVTSRPLLTFAWCSNGYGLAVLHGRNTASNPVNSAA